MLKTSLHSDWVGNSTSPALPNSSASFCLFFSSHYISCSLGSLKQFHCVSLAKDLLGKPTQISGTPTGPISLLSGVLSCTFQPLQLLPTLISASSLQWYHHAYLYSSSMYHRQEVVPQQRAQLIMELPLGVTQFSRITVLHVLFSRVLNICPVHGGFNKRGLVWYQLHSHGWQ